MAELDSGDGLVRFVEGHGLQSRFFAFSWQSDELRIDFSLPYARVLSDEDAQNLDSARIGAAIRMAILLLVAASEGVLLCDGEAAVSVSTDESGTRYAIVGADGGELDSGEDWDPLIARLDSVLADSGGDLQIIWP